MAKTSYQINTSQQAVHHRRYRRRSRLAVLAVLLFAAVTIAIVYDVLRLEHAGEKKPVGATYSQTIAGPTTFRNSYFQFSDSAKWQYAPYDSGPSKLTYLLYEAGVPAHMITVYVNQTPLTNDLAVTRVLPVQIKDGNSFTLAGDISDRCGSLYKPTDLKVIKTVTLAGTSMLCVPDSPQFIAVVGQVGGDFDLTLKRGDGGAARYIIIYHNLTVSPDPAPFVRVMKTFQAV